MLKIVLTAFVLPLLLLFGLRDAGSSNAPNAAKTSPAKQGESGTLQKMIVASGSVSLDIDLNRINGISSTKIGDNTFWRGTDFFLSGASL